MARIFISHSSRNNAEALALRNWLVSQGWNDLFLDIHPADGLVAAERWRAALRASIGRCKAVMFCLSPEWLASPHCISEFNEAMHVGAAPVGVIVRPVPLERLPGEITSVWQIVDLTRAGTAHELVVAPPPERRPVTVSFPSEELRVLRAGLAKLGLVGFDTESFPWPPQEDPERSPYRGLTALDAMDAGIFFGRDSDLIRMREELRALRAKGGGQLVVILGPSGAGKSSFLRAGVMPRLGREDRDFLALPVIRPRTEAISGGEGLAASMARAFQSLNVRRPSGDIGQTLKGDPNAIPGLLAELQEHAAATLVGDAQPQVPRPPTLVLAIDQVEELIAPEGRTESDLFLRILVAALKHGPDTIVVATIQSDRYSQLREIAGERGFSVVSPFDLGPIAPHAFRDAIAGPARRATRPLKIDAQLAEQLTGDMAAQGADPLPLLAFTLERLYRDFGRFEGEMRLEHYHKLGGLTGSIEAAVKEAFSNPDRHPSIPADTLTRDRLLESVFVPALADINEANSEPVRRIAAMSEIPEAGKGLVARLVEARLLVLGTRTTPAAANETTVDVVHEALLRQWQTLRRILDRRSADLRELREIERLAEAWSRAHSWNERLRQQRAIQRLDTRLGSLSAFVNSSRRDLRDLFRGSEWLDHTGDRLEQAEKLLARPDFAVRLKGGIDKYLIACRRSENFARRQARARSSSVRLALYSILLLGCLALLASQFSIGS